MPSNIRRSDFERLLSIGALGVTLVLSGLIAIHAVGEIETASEAPALGLLEALAFYAIVGGFLYGSFVYFITRMGHWQRLSGKGSLSAACPDDGEWPSLTVLIPSYQEEPRTIRQTLLSAALLDYPAKKIVLLIDDSPRPANFVERALLEGARRCVRDVQASLDACLADIDREIGLASPGQGTTAAGLGRAYSRLAARLLGDADDAESERGTDHTDRFFAARILREPAERLERRAGELLASRSNEGDLHLEAAQLRARFAVRLSSFERKRYVNLSHEPNKAMNINSYLGLLGKTVGEFRDGEGLRLDTAEDGTEIEEPKYVLTLDADSLLLEGYARALIPQMEARGGERIAVVQTPYSSIPGAKGILERIAGATTDIQYLIHQGFTRFGATYWVGANAVLRVAALRDIADRADVDGVQVVRFIQDRTVIEDTESSIDLGAKGWSLVNHPQRLSYSATPPDAGSLLIQRRRWSNGGLIIFPKLARRFVSSDSRPSFAEAFLRAHYLLSPAMVNIGLLLAFLYPFRPGLVPIWLPLSALPYLILYGRDLVAMGYRASDLIRVYALNLVLLPINLGGVIKSFHQAVTGKRSPFGRTPKVGQRTAMPATYVLAEVALAAYLGLGAAADFWSGNLTHFVFAGTNAALLTYGLIAFVGVRAGASDLARPLVDKIALLRLSQARSAGTQPELRGNLLLPLTPVDASSRVRGAIRCDCFVWTSTDEIRAMLASAGEAIDDGTVCRRGRPHGTGLAESHPRRLVWDARKGRRQVSLSIDFIPAQGGCVAYFERRQSHKPRGRAGGLGSPVRQL